MSGRPNHDAPAASPPTVSASSLRSFRRQADFTQSGLADQAGLSTAAIRDLEQGRTRSPKPDSIDAIAAVLALSSRDTALLHPSAKANRAPTLTPSTGALRSVSSVRSRSGTATSPLSVNSTPHVLAGPARARGRRATVSQDELVDLLWPRGLPANAANLLQTRITRLRRLLEAGDPGTPMIVGGRAGYRLEATTENLDLLRFRELVAKAADAAPEAALAGLTDALTLWRGEPDNETSHPVHLTVANEYAEAVHTFAALARETGVPEQALKTLRQPDVAAGARRAAARRADPDPRRGRPAGRGARGVRTNPDGARRPARHRPR